MGFLRETPLVGDRLGHEGGEVVQRAGKGPEQINRETAVRMRNLYIVRHTESEHHVQKLLGGWYDFPLTEKGKNQAAQIATNLFIEIKTRGIPVYSSDLKRCSEMADIFAKVFGSQVILNSNLREMNFGEGEGKPQKWRSENIIPKPVDGDRLDYRRFKNAESRREVGMRAYAFLDSILSKPDKNIIAITHGHFSTFLIMAWLKVPVENMGYGDFKVSSGGLTLLNEDDFWGNRNIIYTNKMDYLLE
jgi:probable phosphoglycerate mutase